MMAPRDSTHGSGHHQPTVGQTSFTSSISSTLIGSCPWRRQRRRTTSKLKEAIWYGSLIVGTICLVWLAAAKTPLHLHSTTRRALQEPRNDDGTISSSLELKQQPKSPSKRRSAIPHILIFTHSVNLWNYSTTANNNNNMTSEESDELLALAANVHSIAERHPTAQVRFLTNDDCVASIRAFVRLVQENRSSFATTTVHIDADELIRYFHKEPRGMYKADLCRGTALYESGGVYLDVDVGVRLTPLWDVLQPATEFATVRVHRQSHYPGAFFQAFIAATPRHDVIQRYVELFVQYYRGSLQLKPGPLGVLLLKRAYDEIQAIQQLQMQEAPSTSRSSVGATNSTSQPALKTTHLNATSEIWQEILYAPQLQSSILSHVPPPVWGRRRACKFVVATAPRLPLVVPLYSRIAGSRMCPRQTNATTGWYQATVAAPLEEP
jgi:Glycosyltransferase sugar-binding region containing DXD motif